MEHCTPKNNKLSIDKDIKTYGKENFILSVLCECNVDECYQKEKEFILKLKPFYNTKVLDNSVLEATRLKIKQSNKKWWSNLPENTKSKIIKNNLTNRFKQGHQVPNKCIDALRKTHEKQKVKVKIIELNLEFNSIQELEKYLKVCSGTFRKYELGKIKSIKGYQARRCRD